MFNIFQYEKINKSRRDLEVHQKKEQQDQLIRTKRTNNLSTQANIRRLD